MMRLTNLSLTILLLAISGGRGLIAGLDYESPFVTTGAGFGNDPRMLTVHALGNATTESGCVGLQSTNLLVGPAACSSGLGPTGGDEEKPFGFPKQSAPTLGDLGITSASSLGILFD